MPSKDPNIIAAIIAYISGSSGAQGALIASATAFFRAIYFGEKKIVKIILDTIICGFLSLGAAGLIDVIEMFMGKELPETVFITACSMLGFVGVSTFRELLVKWFKRNTDYPPRPRHDRGEDGDF